jgi:pimeloyl-ACP methyl ester carboxylesterase
MTSVQIPGGELFTRMDGDSGKPWLVLSNSLASDHTMWDGQMPLLTERYRVIRYDTRGHGQSAAPLAPYSFDDLVGDVLAGHGSSRRGARVLYGPVARRHDGTWPRPEAPAARRAARLLRGARGQS